MSSLFSCSSPASSDSENEMRGNMKFDIDKIDFNQMHFSFTNSPASNSSRQTPNGSSSYFKNRTRKNKLETQLKMKPSVTSYTLLQPLKTNNLHYSNNETNYNNKKQDFIKKRTERSSNYIDLSKEFAAYLIESSSNSADSPGTKHFKQISKTGEIDTSSFSSTGSTETRTNKSYTTRKKSTVKSSYMDKENIKPIELLMSSGNSIAFSEFNSNFPNVQSNDLCSNNDIFLDSSFSGVALVQKHNRDRNIGKLYETPDTGNSFIQRKTSKSISPLKSLQMNTSFGIDVDKNRISPSKLMDISITLSDFNNLINVDGTEYARNKTVGISKHVSPLPKHFKRSVSFEFDDHELLLQKQTDVLYQSDLNDLPPSDDSTEDVRNRNIGIFKSSSPIKPIQINISFGSDVDESLLQKSTDCVMSILPNDLKSDADAVDMQCTNFSETKEREHTILLKNGHFEIDESKSLSYVVGSNESEPSTSENSKSNAESIDSTSKYHRCNNRSKSKIKNIHVDSESKDNESKKTSSTPKHPHENGLNEPEPSNYAKSNAESIDSTTSKRHQYNIRSKNKIQNTSRQIDSGPKEKKRRISKRSNEVDLDQLEPLLMSNYTKSNAKSIDSTTSKRHQYNIRSKNKIQNTSRQIDSGPNEKKRRISKRSNEVDLDQLEPLSMSNYTKSNAKSIDSTTSKRHQYNIRSKNKIQNTSRQIDSGPKEKKRRISKRLNEVDLDQLEPLSMSNYTKSNAKSIDSTPKRHQYNSRSKNKIKNTQIDFDQKENNKNKERNKSKRPRETTATNTSDVLPIIRPSGMKNIKKIRSSTNIPEDIGLEYDTSKDDYMIELPNGAVIPAFLSTLKPKYEKKLCACGISTSEAPIFWTESFHDTLHQNIYKLRFKGEISDNDTISVKQNDLIYRILILGIDRYDDGDIKKSVKNVDDFVCLEYGIFKTEVLSYKNATYLAILPNFKVIGYLEVEPTHVAYRVTNDEQEKTLGNKVSVKFGIPKIWVLIKYKNKNVDINLLETFRKKEHLRKEDLAFSLGGCQGVQFIQEYTGNTNILIYKN